MTLWEACCCSLLRSLLHAVIGVFIAIPLGNWLRTAEGRGRWLLWVAVLLPFFIPSLVVGFYYRGVTLSLIHYPAWNELLYGTLILCRVIPVGAVIVSILPSPSLSKEAIHLHRLRFRSQSQFPLSHNVIWTARRWSLHAVLAGFAMFLLSFQESELAALMMVTTWTEWLFTQQAGGLPMSDSLWFATRPLLFQAVVWIPCLWFAGRTLLQGRLASHERPSPDRCALWLLTIVLIVSHLLVVVVPLTMLVTEGIRGMAVLSEQPRLGGEIVSGLIMAAVAGTIAYHIAGWGVVIPRKSRGFHHGAIVIVIAAAGLLGNLIIGLSFANLFQQSWLNATYDTPMPWGLALIVLLLPLAIIIRWTLATLESGESTHLARLLEESQDQNQRSGGRWLAWMLTGRGEFWGGAMVCWLAYTDLMTASLLAPPKLTPAPIRLYNFLHYGRISGLAAMMLVTMLAPLVVISIVYVARRLLVRLL